MIRFVTILGLVAALCRAQDNATLRAGLELTASLTLDQQADAQIFRTVGLENSSTQLKAVMSAGMNLSSSAPQRLAMHRATEGLTELAVEQRRYSDAASFSSVQHENYRHLDHDYEAALKASQNALAFEKQSGDTEVLDLFHEGVARDYLALNRNAEALASFRQAQAAENGITTDRASWIARGAAQAEIALGHIENARLEVAKLLASQFKPAALLAQSDLQIADGQFEAALASVKDAKNAGASLPEVINQLATMNLLATRSLPFDQAIGLSRKIEADFSEFSITPFIEDTVAFRRRLAGDTAGTLRDKLADVESARKSNDVIRQIQALSSLAVLYRSLNSITDQVATLEEAHKLELTEPPFEARAYSRMRTLNQLGDAYLTLTFPRFSLAEKCFAEAIQTFNSLKEPESQMKAASQYGLTILGLARCNFLDPDGEPEQGRKLMLGALESLPRNATYDKSDVLVLLARMEAKENRLPQAAQYFEKTIAELHNGGWLTYEAVARGEYAQFLLTIGVRLSHALEEAEKQIIAEESAAKQLNMAEAQWRAAYQRGLLAEAKGDRAATLAAYRASIAKLESVRSDIFDTGQRQTYVDREMVQDLYSRAFALVAGAGDLAQVWDLMERAKARSFLDSLGVNRFHASATGPDARRNVLLEKVANTKLQLKPESVEVLRASGQAPAAATLQNLEQELRRIREGELLARSRAGNAAAAHPISLDALYKLLPPKTALVEFGIAKNELLVAIATRNRGILTSRTLDVALLEGKVKELKAWLSSGQDSETPPALGFVSENVLASFLPSIGPGIDHLIVIPTRFLNDIPFSALQTKEGKMLIDTFTVSYLPSASVLQFVSTVAPAHSKVFLGAIGNVPTGKSALPGTLDETAAIAKLYPETERAYEADFTHDRARNALLEDDVVHFATHGEIDSQSPMFNSLVTAPAPGQPNQLSVYELPGLAIRAKIVILSACETAKGTLSKGDELSGLTRALLTAGADTVISSLWQVDDRSTAMLMEEFHRELLNGAAPSDALRTAGLRVRKEFPQPHYWAPFIVTGVR